MRREKRRTIAAVIRIEPYLYGLQDRIEDEQEKAIADMVSPAEKVVSRLIALDNRRIDLCNLKVLYTFIERGLNADFGVFKTLVETDADSGLYDRAEAEMKRVGYDAERAAREFGYLFKNFKRKKKRVVPEVKESAIFKAL